MSGAALLGVTFPDHDTAASIARTVVEERLAACANLLPCTSIYRWEDAVEQAGEVLAQFKTSAARAPELAARIAELHPYDLPAIEWAPAQATDAVLSWINEAVSSYPS